METIITRREAIIVARRMRRAGYSNAVRAARLEGRSIREAAIEIAGDDNPREVAETIIGIMQYSIPNLV